jgi:SAM-dependent methyltransferase
MRSTEQMTAADSATRPGYADFRNMRDLSAKHAEAFANQALLTCGTDLPKPVQELEVLDVGSGYGWGTVVLADRCRRAVGIEPMAELHASAKQLTGSVDNVEFRHGGVESLEDIAAFDLVVLDNVFEHLADQVAAMQRIDRALRPGGVVYMLMPNRLWPLEVHYQLPFLGWLPLSVANRYLRLSGRGTDYTDASHARTLWGLRRALATQPDWSWRMALPADPTATHAGTPAHYRLGMSALRRAPWLWAISKSFLVVAKKQD